MSHTRSSRRLAPSEFGALFHWIASASLASGLSACTSEEEPPNVPALDAGLSADAGRSDAGAQTPTDAGPRPDAGSPPDAAQDATSDAGGLPYQPLPCQEGLVVLPPPLVTTPPAESVGIFAANSLADGPPLAEHGYYARLRYGADPCAAASDPAACNESLSAVQRALPCDTADLPECDIIAVRSSGQSFARITSRAELLALFGGTIDALAEAMLLAAYDNHIFSCPGLGGTQPLSGTTTHTDAAGVHVQSEWEECGSGLFRERYLVAPDGSVTGTPREKIGESLCAIGRRPSGLRALPAELHAPLADYVCAASELEAASVFAFRELEDELAALGAPEALRAAAREAVLDELAHTHVMAQLARSYGATPRAPVVARSPARSAFQLACENAREGCVRETYGALLATYQAAAARDADLRAAMQGIARDETRHAQLSWRIHAWLAPQLSHSELALVQAARDEAVRALFAESAASVLGERERAALGLPAPEVASELLAQLARTVWS